MAMYIKTYEEFFMLSESTEVLSSGPLSVISPEEARQRKLFGPVYHGTSQSNIERINKEGFKVYVGSESKTDNTEHGYELGIYKGTDYTIPVHHLGYGVYFTTNKSIAKQYNNNSIKGLQEYWLDVPRLEEINFGSPNTMMKWWRKNGYDSMKWLDVMDQDLPYQKKLQQASDDRVRATINLTNTLKNKYDAVWYKGKGLYKLLDGDQVCVYEPKGKIYRVDYSLAGELEIGSKVTINPEAKLRNASDAVEPGIVGIITGKREIESDISAKFWDGAKYFISVKWKRGGTTHNQTEKDLLPYKK